MTRQATIVAMFFCALGAASRAEAQYTTPAQSCPPGQPCVVGPQAQQPVVQSYPVATQRQPVEVKRSQLRWAMIGPGIGMLAGGWLGNWLVGIIGGLATLGLSPRYGDYLGWSFVPVVGPWVNLTYFDGSLQPGFIVIHTLFGVLQGGGLLLCILGTVLREEVVEVRYVLGDDADGPTLSVLPYVHETGGGLVATVAGF